MAKGFQMKAKLYDRIITIDEIPSQFQNKIPVGTEGTVVECYSTPTEGYAVDLRFPSAELVGGFSYENVVLKPEQFRLILQWSSL
jgi:hypothetical protein